MYLENISGVHPKKKLALGKTFQTWKGVIEFPVFVGIPIAIGLEFYPKIEFEKLELIAGPPEFFGVWEFGAPLNCKWDKETFFSAGPPWPKFLAEKPGWWCSGFHWLNSIRNSRRAKFGWRFQFFLIVLQLHESFRMFSENRFWFVIEN